MCGNARCVPAARVRCGAMAPVLYARPSRFRMTLIEYQARRAAARLPVSARRAIASDNPVLRPSFGAAFTRRPRLRQPAAGPAGGAPEHGPPPLPGRRLIGRPQPSRGALRPRDHGGAADRRSESLPGPLARIACRSRRVADPGFGTPDRSATVKAPPRSGGRIRFRRRGSGPFSAWAPAPPRPPPEGPPPPGPARSPPRFPGAVGPARGPPRPA